jgi:hypothetical protein
MAIIEYYYGFAYTSKCLKVQLCDMWWICAVAGDDCGVKTWGQVTQSGLSLAA